MMLKKRTLALLAAAMMIVTAGCTPGPASSNPAPQSPDTAGTAAGPASSNPAPQSPDSASMAPQSPDTAGTAAAGPLDLKVGALKGPSVIGMLPMVERSGSQNPADAQSTTYTFTIAGAPDQLVGGVISGEYDIAVLPTNLAATVYNKTGGKVKLATINTLGVLYLVETGDTVKSIADLKGKTIYSSGKGSTPEYALNYILEQNGLKVGTDVTVEYRTEHSEISAMLAAGQATIAVLPQPFVQGALAQNDKLRVALDLTREWETAAKDGGSLAMSGIVVQQKLLDEHPEAVAAFLTEYKASTEQVNDPTKLDAIAELAVKYEIIPKAPIAKAAIPQCNIVFLDGSEMKAAASGFLNVLFAANPQSVGGKLPDDGFYYQAP